MKTAFLILLLAAWQMALGQARPAQPPVQAQAITDTTVHKGIYNIGNLPNIQTTPVVNFPEVTIISLKNQQDMLAHYRAQIIKVLPYVKIAKQLYFELKENEDTSGRKEYRHYRHDVEKLMRSRFEKELKDLNVNEGKMLFKLINRETGNNCYNLISDIKNPVTAWFYQTIAKRWGYDLKAPYNPKNETIIELIIKQLGPAYHV